MVKVGLNDMVVGLTKLIIRQRMIGLLCAVLKVMSCKLSSKHFLC